MSPGSQPLHHLMEQNMCNRLWGTFGGNRTPPPDHHHGGVVIHGTVVVATAFGRTRPGKATTVVLYSSTHIDRDTGKGVLSVPAKLRKGKKTRHGKTSTVTYQVTFNTELEFGSPGAIAVKNGNKSEFFLKYVSLTTPDRTIHFDCNSWVYPFKKTNSDRLFFINTSYLPSKTPLALRELRQEDLKHLRGNGRGERKDWERVYDYDYYNDLGDPDKQEHVRPVLGGTRQYPYPRRIRTGRPMHKADEKTETRNKIINLDFYVPHDERFSPSKLLEFILAGSQAVLHFVIPEVRALFQGDINNFRSFDQLKKDFYHNAHPSSAYENLVTEKLREIVPENTYKEVTRRMKESPGKFPVPQVIAKDENAWRTDDEFAREMLAGLNPTVIRCLEEFPPGRRSSISASHLEGKLEGLSIRRAIDLKRLFILNHHDYLMPFLARINAQGLCIYASRTLLFLGGDGTLKPLVIELTLPGGEAGEKEINRVFLPANHGIDGALWQLAKTHVAVNDSGYHQLVSHWLFTHAAVEPFIIATKRQLSAMHPVYKLLNPHFKDNMQINALARSILLNAGGILERTMFPGKYAMEMSSAIYKSWRFTEQALPIDLLKRGMAVEDPESPAGVRPVIADYPYAADGLEIWEAIGDWVSNYCNHFYHSDDAVAGDAELQRWWEEVRFVGHGDRIDDEDCWMPLDSVENLSAALTILIWIASALHAAVNFGQYDYAGFPPNRPTRCRRFIPAEGSPEYAELARDPEKFFLETVPDRFTTTLGIALIEVLSRHFSDEEYLGQRGAGWTDDGEVLRLFEQFREELLEVEWRIGKRNEDAKLKNRRGPAVVPYTLLFPDAANAGAGTGLTGRGIPNSVSI